MDVERDQRVTMESKATVFPACNSWLNFRVRGQFKIKILIVRHTNTTYFIWIFKKIKVEPVIIWNLVTSNKRITSKKYLTSMGRQLSPSDTGTLFWQLSIDHNIDVQCVCITGGPLEHYQFSCALKLARKDEIEHWTINGSADSFQINHLTSMSWQMSPRYGHVIMVSGYPVLTAVNWPFSECLIYKMWTCQDTPETPPPSLLVVSPTPPLQSMPYSLS